MTVKITRPVWLDALAVLAAEGEYGLTATDVLLGVRVTRVAFDFRTGRQVVYLTHRQTGALIDASEATGKRFWSRMIVSGLMTRVKGSGRVLHAGGIARETYLHAFDLSPDHLVMLERRRSQETAVNGSEEPTAVTGEPVRRSGVTELYQGYREVNSSTTTATTTTRRRPQMTAEERSERSAEVDPTQAELTAQAMSVLRLAASLRDSPFARAAEKVVELVDVWTYAEFQQQRESEQERQPVCPSAELTSVDLDTSIVDSRSGASLASSPRTSAAGAAPVLGSARAFGDGHYCDEWCNCT